MEKPVAVVHSPNYNWISQLCLFSGSVIQLFLIKFQFQLVNNWKSKSLCRVRKLSLMFVLGILLLEYVYKVCHDKKIKNDKMPENLKNSFSWFIDIFSSNLIRDPLFKPPLITLFYVIENCFVKILQTMNKNLFDVKICWMHFSFVAYIFYS